MGMKNYELDDIFDYYSKEALTRTIQKNFFVQNTITYSEGIPLSLLSRYL